MNISSSDSDTVDLNHFHTKQALLEQCMQNVESAIHFTDATLDELQEQREELEGVQRSVGRLHSALETASTRLTRIEKMLNPFKIIHYSRRQRGLKKSEPRRSIWPPFSNRIHRNLSPKTVPPSKFGREDGIQNTVLLSGTCLKKSNWVRRWNRRFFQLTKHTFGFSKKQDNSRRLYIPLLLSHIYCVDWTEYRLSIITRRRVQYDFRFYTREPLAIIVRHLEQVKHFPVRVYADPVSTLHRPSAGSCTSETDAPLEDTRNSSVSPSTLCLDYTPLLDSLDELLHKQTQVGDALHEETAVMRRVSSSTEAACDQMSQRVQQTHRLKR